MKNLWLASVAIALGFTAAPAAADPPAAEASDSRQRSTGFFAMDREDHRDWTLELAGGAMYLDADGKIGFESNSRDYVFGVNALDLEREWSGWAGIDLKFARKHHLRFGFLPVEFDGERSIEIALPPEDPIFAIGDRVESRAKLHTYQLSYLYDFYLGEYVTLSPSLTLGLIDAKVRIADDTLGLDFDEEQLVPLPELGPACRSSARARASPSATRRPSGTRAAGSSCSSTATSSCRGRTG